MESHASANIALTYFNDKHTDGAGAQLQRVYGIYAISRFLRLPYIHSPLIRIDYQGLPALESNHPSPEFESRFNRAFAIPSDIELPEKVLVYELMDADFALLKRIQSSAQNGGTFAVVRILYPYPITDQIPEVYRHVRAISPFLRTPSDVFRIALHVRRGEHIALASERMLPNSYFISCALRFTSLLEKLGIPFVCELYTEVPSKPFVATPWHHGILGRIPGDVVVDPKANRLEDFDVLPNLVKFVNGDPIQTLERMATADALVLSRSSFSYVAAILNANGIVAYHPFWHSPLNDWVISDENGAVSEEVLIERIECWRRQQSLPKRASASA